MQLTTHRHDALLDIDDSLHKVAERPFCDRHGVLQGHALADDEVAVAYFGVRKAPPRVWRPGARL